MFIDKITSFFFKPDIKAGLFGEDAKTGKFFRAIESVKKEASEKYGEIQIDPETGKFSGREPLKTLAKYRKFNGEVVFGQNLIPRSSGILEVGMKVEVVN